MTIKEILNQHHNIEIELLLARVLNKPKEFLYLNSNFKLTTKQYNNLTKLIKRRQKGEPVAYIFGYKDFYGLRFKVNKDVLVPRPETEIVVELVASGKLLAASKKPIKILDVGTGSGCIIVSLAKGTFAQSKGSLCSYEFHASDVSKKALAVAKQNARTHKVKVHFHHSDLLKNIKENFDIIIANLPYGWKEWKNNSSVATVGLKFEPQNALFTKENGLYLIRILLEQVATLASLPSLIYLEFDPRQKSNLSRLIKKTLPKSKATFYKDYGNKWRYVEIKKPGLGSR